MADDLHVAPLRDFALAAIQARAGVCADAIGAALGGSAPDSPCWTHADGCHLLGTGLGSWLVYADRWTPDWELLLRSQLAGLASVSDQSSAYEIFRITGADARRVLQRGIAIDLDPVSFGPSGVTVSAIAHIGVTLWHLDDAPTYNVACFRSYAASLQHWLDHQSDRKPDQ